MSYPVFQVPAGDVLPIFFSSYAGATGASITCTGLAVTDIEVYKDGGTTQRASDAGYTLLDTDGIDFDAITGIHGFSIDTGDNTDAGFYTTGAWFTVVVSAITVDSQTVSFVAAQFRIMAAETVAAVPKVDVSHWLGTAVSTPTVAGVPNVNVKTWNDLTTVALPLVPTTAGRTLDVSATGEAGIDWANIGSPTTAVNLSATNIDVDQVVASVSGAVGSVTGLTASNLDAAVSTLATAANLATVAGYIDTEIGDIQSRLPAALVGGRMDASVGAVAANAITAAGIADGAIDRATFAADTGLVTIRSNTAQAGASTSITLDASASAVTDFYKNDLIVLTGGTGAGQGRYCTAYNGTTKVATVSAWATNPDVTSTFAIIAADAIVGATAPTAAQVADEVQTRTIAAVTVVNGLAANVITAAATAADFTTEIQAGLATAADLATVATYIDTEVAAIKAVTDALPNAGALTTIQADLDNIQTRIPAALVGGRMDADISAIGTSTTALAAFKRAVQGNVIGTVGSGSTTTSIVTSAVTPATSVADQLKGRILTFADDTTTAALRGQATDITASSASATPVLTVTALTTAAVSGDTFTIT